MKGGGYAITGIISRLQTGSGDVYDPIMQLLDDDLNEFIRIYKEEFGDELTKAEASEMANRMMALYEVLATGRPPEQEQLTPTPLDADSHEDHPRIGFRT
jgi:hypothetical protein